MIRYKIKDESCRLFNYDNSDNVYKKIETKSNVWYVSLASNAGDDIYVYVKNEDPDSYFKGYGGATLMFKLEDGTIDAVKGPWHSNSGALLSDTGYDVTNKFYTFGVIGKGRAFDDDHVAYIDDVIYKDETWTIGGFNRISEMAQKMADQLNVKVWYYVQSIGGSTTAWKDPKSTEDTLN